MRFDRRYTTAGQGPYAGIDFVARDSVIHAADGSVVHRFDGVSAPVGWSQLAVDMLAQKYIRRAGVPQWTEPDPEPGVPEFLFGRCPAAGTDTPMATGSERDARQVMNRMAGAWTYWGWKLGYFDNKDWLQHALMDRHMSNVPADHAVRFCFQSAEAFRDEIACMLMKQMAAPNSPQWFNTGLAWAYGITGPPQGHFWADNEGVYRSVDAYTHPAAHACFIQSVQDTLLGDEGIMGLVQREARVFKFGGGSGSNFSLLRGAGEPLSGGGRSSGLMSWLKINDRAAGAIKSGGTTRRAAKMVVVDADHPDIEEFTTWKVGEEQKVAMLVAGSVVLSRHLNAMLTAAQPPEPSMNGSGEQARTSRIRVALRKALEDGIPLVSLQEAVDLAAQGVTSLEVEVFDTDFEHGAYTSVSGQNANNTVRMTDDFVRQAQGGGDWHLFWRTDLAREPDRSKCRPCKVVPARRIWDQVVFSNWRCGDPGVQFDTTINDWHTCLADGRIKASNPCQPGFATVLTPEGIQTFDTIDVGSVIWSGSQWTRVVRKVETGIKMVFSYHTRAGMFIGTEEHQVLANGCRVQAAQAETIDVAVGPPASAGDFDPQTVVDGLVLGDGTLKVCNAGRSRYKLLCVGQNDQWLWQCEDLLPFVNPEVFDKVAHRVQTGLSEDEVGRKTYEREIPDRYFFAAPTIVRSFLRGLYAANGSVVDGRVTLKAASLPVIQRVQQMLSSLGIRSYYTINKAHDVVFKDGVYTCRQSYDLNITGGRQQFRSLIGFIDPSKTARLDAACQIGESRPKRSYEVAEIQPLGEFPVYDITVDANEHTYWTGGLLVSNCGEYHFIDDTGCNLASLNLLAFYNTTTRTFDVEGFRHAVNLWTTVLDITVSMAGYPSAEIARGSRNYRTLGLGYTNLGALLMAMGLPYDSDDGRLVAATITAILHFTAYQTSACLAAQLGTFPRYEANKESCLRVINNHAAAASPAYDFQGLHIIPPALIRHADPDLLPDYLAVLVRAARHDADRMIDLVNAHGLRNAQVTVIAPTGTIALLMDCDTTGIEPDYALVKHKKMAGGGYAKIVNRTVPAALKALGYAPEAIKRICVYATGHQSLQGSPISPDILGVKYFTRDQITLLEGMAQSCLDVRHVLPELADHFTPQELDAANLYVCGTGTLEGAPGLRPEHLPVFDTANRCGSGTRSIRPEAHILMLATAQPFVSGAISKTVNGPRQWTLADVSGMLMMGWELGVKNMTLYRNFSKLCQVLTSSLDADSLAVLADQELARPEASPELAHETREEIITKVIYKLQRRLMPDRRPGYTQKARIGGHKVYLRTGEYPDGTLGEIFIDLHKEGAALRSWSNCFAIAVSLGLQHGVPLEEFVDAFTFTRFEPWGPVHGNEQIKSCTSFIDYLFRELAVTYLGRSDLSHATPPTPAPPERNAPGLEVQRMPEPVGTYTKSSPSPVPARVGVPMGEMDPARWVFRGYLGDACGQCGQLALVRTGNCVRCDNCGANSGCS